MLPRNEVAEHSPGWLQAGKNSKHIGRSHRKVELLSAYSNQWLINHHPRKSKQKSGNSKSPEVLLLLERVDLWLWRLTNLAFVSDGGADYQSLIRLFVGDFRLETS